MSLPKVALDDTLFVEYFKFKNNKSTDHELIYKLISNLKMPFAQSNLQALRCINELTESLSIDEVHSIISPELQTAYISGGLINESLEELSQKTLYKILLTNDESKNEFPYVNISSPCIEINYSKYCSPNDSRTSLLDHIKELCSNATKIVICDNYLPKHWQRTKNLFVDILPKNSLNIEYIEVPPYPNYTAYSIKKTEIESICSLWVVSENTTNLYQNRHDRYLRIISDTNTIEIILSSGFDYLWRTNKEITCLFREL
ncbi:hypothetical protein HWA77_11975 [Photobacterium damselae subsp. damselae]|uniref:Uncharacterized protein n=1 Tax=Photobacterium damselae subsp. damselae TaxID=85581 RepID=A0A850R1F5_PHODD|nr:hypothetical protein [Photobacterium damselae subsp. damselae]